MQEETGEDIFMSFCVSNADPQPKLEISKFEEIITQEFLTQEIITPKLESPKKEEETIISDQDLTRKPVRKYRSVKKQKEQPIVKPKEQPVAKPKDKKYGICPHCGDRYAQSSLSLHIRRHTGEKPYKCDMCEKAFVELHDLKRHKRMHTGEKPHVCATCGKAFSQQNKLTRHNLIHTGERPYKCDQCDKAFSQRNELNLHIRRHTGDKPYMCGICGECFITGTFLRNHQKSVSHFEEEKQDRFIKIRVTNPSRSYRRKHTKDEC